MGEGDLRPPSPVIVRAMSCSRLEAHKLDTCYQGLVPSVLV